MRWQELVKLGYKKVNSSRHLLHNAIHSFCWQILTQGWIIFIYTHLKIKGCTTFKLFAEMITCTYSRITDLQLCASAHQSSCSFHPCHVDKCREGQRSWLHVAMMIIITIDVTAKKLQILKHGFLSHGSTRQHRGSVQPGQFVWNFRVIRKWFLTCKHICLTGLVAFWLLTSDHKNNCDIIFLRVGGLDL